MAQQVEVESLVLASRPGSDSASGPASALWLAALGSSWTILGAALAGGLLLAGVGAVLPSEYTAKASFLPDAGQATGFLGGLVGQFIGLQSDKLPPRLAGDLVRSDPVLARLIYQRFATSLFGTTDSARLLDLIKAGGRDSAQMEFRALKKLRDRIAVDVNERTGVVDVLVTLRNPVVAATVANSLVDMVDDFNTQTRQSRGRALRVFLEARTGSAEKELKQAERFLQEFYMENRRFQESPKLTLEEARLRRDVDLKQGVYVSLSQQLEQARIDEVKDTPVLTHVAIATIPVKRSFPRLSLFAFLGIVLGAVAVIVPVIVRAYVKWYAAWNPVGYAHFRDALDRVARSTPSALRRVGAKQDQRT